MLKEGARVYHSGHGLGTIVAHNTTKPNSYAAENLGLGAAAEDLLRRREVPSSHTTPPSPTATRPRTWASARLLKTFYDGARYPYVIQFDSGYKDVYALNDVTEVLNADPEETQA